MILVLGPGVTSSNFGFEGHLDLRAGSADPVTGIAPVDLIGASPYLSIDLNPGAPIVFCLRPIVPVENAGALDCDGGADLGAIATQDHNVGEVGSGGFTAESCAAQGGTVEGETDPHPSVCNGPIAFSPSGESSSSGALEIGLNTTLGLAGLPVELTVESALPCGDEGGGSLSSFGFTTALSRAEIADSNNSPGAVLTHDARGESFTCDSWVVENGPGRLVFALPALHGFGTTDAITAFVFDD